MRLIRKWWLISAGMGLVAVAFLIALTVFGSRSGSGSAALPTLGEPMAGPQREAVDAASDRTDRWSPQQVADQSQAKPAVTLLPWSMALKNERRDRYQAASHRAAVSGKLSDLMALRTTERACQNFMIGLGLYTTRGLTLTPAQMAHFESRRAECERGGVPSTSQIPLKDDEGLGDLAGSMMRSVLFSLDKADPHRQAVVAAVLESGSIELLDATRLSFMVEDAYRAGMSRGEQPLLDYMLMDVAIRIQACTARGDCEIVAMDQLDCAESHSCLTDLRDFPATKLLVAPDQRAFPFRHPDLSTEMLRARWDAIQTFLRSRFGSKP